MFDNPDLVALIYGVFGTVFLGGLFLGAATTFARVLFYRAQGRERPELLTRDILTYGGLAISFGIISAVRLLPLDQRQALSGNVLWAVATSIPAALGVLVYCWFEIFVIERGPKAKP